MVCLVYSYAVIMLVVVTPIVLMALLAFSAMQYKLTSAIIELINEVLMRIFLILFTSFLLSACDSNPGAQILKINGSTMGTYYHVSWVGDDVNQKEALQHAVENRLVAINKSMSTYDNESELSLLNQDLLAKDAEGWVSVSADLAEVLGMSLDVWSASRGDFDVTVGPLVNLWGFGPEARVAHIPEVDEIKSKLSLIGSNNIELDRLQQRVRINKSQYVDLSAVAKGWAVDEIAEVVEQQGIMSYMVEIGGEIRAQGVKPNNQPWRIAIERPQHDLGQSVALVIELDGQGIATSGSYRNYFEEEGVRFSHTIDPKTGYPIKHKLASVTVVHPSTGMADAWATAITVAGAERGLQLADENNLSVFMLVGKEGGEGFDEIASREFIKKYPQVKEGRN